MHVHERFAGTVDGEAVDDDSDFVMRCWTADELRDGLVAAGFRDFELAVDGATGAAPDRIAVTARR